MKNNKKNNNLSTKEFIRQNSSIYKLLKLCISRQVSWPEIRETLSYDTIQENIYTSDRKMTPTLGEIVFSLDEEDIISLLKDSEFETFFKELSYSDEAMALLMEQNYYKFLNIILDTTSNNLDILLEKKKIQDEDISAIDFNYSIIEHLAQAQSNYIKFLEESFKDNDTGLTSAQLLQQFINFNQKFYKYLNHLDIERINKICDWTVPETQYENFLNHSISLIENKFSNDEEKETLVSAYALDAIRANSTVADIKNIKGLKTFNMLGQANMLFVLGNTRKEMLKKGNLDFIEDTQELMSYLITSSSLILKGQDRFFQLDKERSEKMKSLLAIHVPEGDPANDISRFLINTLTKNLKTSSLSGSMPWNMAAKFIEGDMVKIKGSYPTLFDALDTDAAFNIVKDATRLKGPLSLYEINAMVKVCPNVDEPELLGRYCAHLSKYFLQTSSYLNNADSARNFISYLDDMTAQVMSIFKKMKNLNDIVFHFAIYNDKAEIDKTIEMNLDEFKFVILSSLGYNVASENSLKQALPQNVKDFLFNVEILRVDLSKVTPAINKVFLHNYLNLPAFSKHEDNEEVAKNIREYSRDGKVNFKEILMEKFLLNTNVEKVSTSENDSTPGFKI